MTTPTPSPSPTPPVYGPIAPNKSPTPRVYGPIAPDKQPLDVKSLLENAAKAPRDPLSLGTFPGTLDMSLPSNLQLQAAANPDPWRGRDRFAAGNPTEITTIGTAFAQAGGDLEEAHSLSTQTQKLIAQGYTNDGTPVYDEATHILSMPKNFPDAPARLSSVAKQLATTATELTTRTTDAANAVNKMLNDLDQKRADWQTELQAARNPYGLIPYDKFDALRARRLAVAGDMQNAVNTTGTTIDLSVTAYEGILADAMKVLSSIGYVPPDALDAGPGDINFTAAAGDADARSVTAAVDAGPTADLFRKVDEGRRGIDILTNLQRHGGTLTPAQSAYVSFYYDELAKSGTLPRLEGVVNAASSVAFPTSFEKGSAAVENTLSGISNGLMTYSQTHQVPHR